MEKFDYYKAPSDEIFADIKQAATAIWFGYDDPYKSEKLDGIADVQNVSDNAWYLVAMFDSLNQEKLLGMVRPETAHMIRSARGY